MSRLVALGSMKPRFWEGMAFEYKRNVSGEARRWGLAEVREGDDWRRTFVCVFDFLLKEGEEVLEGHRGISQGCRPDMSPGRGDDGL